MSGKKTKKPAKELGAPLWMITYGDMMTLLLCFFILLFSFSTIDVVKFRDVIIELQGALGVLSGGPMVLNLGDIPAKQLTEIPAASAKQMKAIQDAIEEKVQEESIQDSIETTLDERGLMIRFTDAVLFDLGKADIKPIAKPVLDVINEEIAGISNRIQVEGHTDPTPIHTAEFPSNWELSTARATAILHYMIESGGIEPQRLNAAGYAFYHPVVPNSSQENRTRNRRVDVIILKEEENRNSRDRHEELEYIESPESPVSEVMVEPVIESGEPIEGESEEGVIEDKPEEQADDDNEAEDGIGDEDNEARSDE